MMSNSLYGRHHDDVTRYMCHKWPRIWSVCHNLSKTRRIFKRQKFKLNWKSWKIIIQVNFYYIVKFQKTLNLRNTY